MKKLNWSFGNDELIKYFKENPKEIDCELKFTHSNALHYFIRNRNYDMIDKLLDLGADPNFKDSKGNPPIFYALETSNLKCLKILEKYNADFNILIQYKNRTVTPLFISCSLSSLEIVKFIYSKTNNVNYLDEYGNNALFYLPLDKDKKMRVKYILNFLSETEINFEQINSSGENLFFVFIRNGLISHCKLIFKKEYLYIKNSDDFTVLDICLKNGLISSYNFIEPHYKVSFLKESFFKRKLNHFIRLKKSTFINKYLEFAELEGTIFSVINEKTDSDLFIFEEKHNKNLKLMKSFEKYLNHFNKDHAKVFRKQALKYILEGKTL